MAALAMELASGVERGRYYQVPEGDGHSGVRLRYGGYEECGAEYRIDRRTFPSHSIEVVVGGSGRVRVSGEWRDLEGGSVFLYRPGERWMMEGGAGDPLRKFFIVYDLSEDASGRLLSGAGGPFRCRHHAEIVGWMEWIEREAGRPSPMREAVCNALLEGLLCKLRAERTAPGDAPSGAEATYWQALRLVECEGGGIRGTGELARRLGVDPAYLCRLFRRFGQDSPQRALTRMRMEVAFRLLTREGLRVSATAERLGFQNPYHFSRVFKRVHGIPPSACFQ